MFRIKAWGLGIEFDRDYGWSKKTGWSIEWHGHYLVQLEKHLLIAIYKAITYIAEGGE